MTRNNSKVIFYIGLGRFSTLGGFNNCERSEQTERLGEAFTGVQGAGPLSGVARGPFAWENVVFCELNMHNYRPFLVYICRNIWFLLFKFLKFKNQSNWITIRDKSKFRLKLHQNTLKYKSNRLKILISIQICPPF